MFTDDEKAILRSLRSGFDWIARDKDGSINVYEDKPQREEGMFKCQDGYKLTLYWNIDIFKHIFKGLTWENSPIRFRCEVLDKVEIKYLKTVFKPFHNRIKYVKKDSPYAVKEKCYIWACVEDGDNLELPTFDKRKMYKGMKLGKHYTLEELGITYD